MKASVMARLREAERWLATHGPAYEWLRVLVWDTQQELESQSGALWCQWNTGMQSHVRIFVTGEMGPKELDAMLEMLQLSRRFMKEDAAVALPDAAAARGGELD